MKKILLLLLVTISLVSCLQHEEPKRLLHILPVIEATVPDSFTYGEVDTLTVSYTLPNGCYFYTGLYYEYQDTARVVAIKALEDLEAFCAQATDEHELKFPVLASQHEDYLFKFWKGEDMDGNDIFEEIVVPVND